MMGPSSQHSVSFPEVPMRRSADTEPLSLLAVLDAPPMDSPAGSVQLRVDSPAGSVQPRVAAPPPEVKPPANFRERVEQRRAELAAGKKPLWLDA